MANLMDKIMTHLIDKDAVLAEIERRLEELYKLLPDASKVENSSITISEACNTGKYTALESFKDYVATLEVKEVDFEKEFKRFLNEVEGVPRMWHSGEQIEWAKDLAKHFFELGLKAQHDNWKVVNNTNLPQGDKNKIYCVFTNNRYILAKVINHPKDEELLQWKCTEFPHHRYDMCEGDKYMQIV